MCRNTDIGPGKTFIMKKYLFTLCVVLFLTQHIVEAQSAYYNDIDGVQGGETLKTALHNLIKNHVQISYGSGEDATWGAFYTTDVVLGTKNQVADMYSSEKRYFSSKGDAVEGMNIEHCVAKSWWGGGKNNAYYDIHHLNPSDASANSAKSNYPLAELESVSWTNGISNVGKAAISGTSQNAYEPADRYKGDFARTYMYMFTCYQDLTWKYTWMNYENSSYPTLKPWAVELLLKWHKQDPVSEKEVVRNNAVYALQGNRNPYIDYPNLADYVWGDSTAYIFKLNGEPEGGVAEPVVGKLYLNEKFNNDLGEFTTVETIGNYPWRIDYETAYASSYVSDINNEAESWLLSPSLDFTHESQTILTFDYIIRYSDNVVANHRLLVSTDYNGDVEAANWQVIDFGAVESSDWYSFADAEVELPKSVYGCKNVTVAFKYAAATKAGTWEIKNLVLKGNGVAPEEGGDVPGDDTPDTPSVDVPVTDAGVFRKLFSADDLTVGDTIILAYEANAMSTNQKSNNRAVAPIVVSDDMIESPSADVQKIVLEEGAVAGSYAFNAGNGYLYAASSSSNYLRTQAGIDANSSWKISISDDGSARIEAQGDKTHNLLQYNTSAVIFSCYTGTQEPVTIYVKAVSQKTSLEAVPSDDDMVNIYNTQGVCVRRAVRLSEALRGLPRGMYIAGNRKYVVR